MAPKKKSGGNTNKGGNNNTSAVQKGQPASAPTKVEQPSPPPPPPPPPQPNPQGETVSDLIAAEEAAKASSKASKKGAANKAEDPLKPSAELAAEVAALQLTNQTRRNNVTRLTQEKTKESKELERVKGQLENRKRELVALRAQLEENEDRISTLQNDTVATRERTEKKKAVIARREEIAHRNAFTPSSVAATFANSAPTTVRIGSAALASDNVSDDEGIATVPHHPTSKNNRDPFGAIGLTIPAPRGSMAARPALSSFNSFDSAPMPQTPDNMIRSHSSPFADPIGQGTGGYNVFSGVGGLGGSAHPSPFSAPAPSSMNRQGGGYSMYSNTPPSHIMADMSSTDDSGTSTPQPPGTSVTRGFPNAPISRSTLTPGAAPFEPSSLSSNSANNGGWTVTGNSPAPVNNVANLFASAAKNANGTPGSSSSSTPQFQVTRFAVNMPPGAMGAASGFAPDPAPKASPTYYPAGAARSGGQQPRPRGGDFGGFGEEYHPIGHHPRNPQAAPAGQGYYNPQGRNTAGQWGM